MDVSLRLTYNKNILELRGIASLVKQRESQNNFNNFVIYIVLINTNELML